MKRWHRETSRQRETEKRERAVRVVKERERYERAVEYSLLVRRWHLLTALDDLEMEVEDLSDLLDEVEDHVIYINNREKQLRDCKYIPCFLENKTVLHFRQLHALTAILWLFLSVQLCFYSSHLVVYMSECICVWERERVCVCVRMWVWECVSVSVCVSVIQSVWECDCECVLFNRENVCCKTELDHCVSIEILFSSRKHTQQGALVSNIQICAAAECERSSGDQFT